MVVLEELLERISTLPMVWCWACYLRKSRPKSLFWKSTWILVNPHYKNILVNLGLGRQVASLCHPEPLVLTFELAVRPLNGLQVVDDPVSGFVELTIDPNTGQNKTPR